MNNRLNYSTLEDAWGSLIDNNINLDQKIQPLNTNIKGSSIKESTIKNNYTYRKPTNNILEINSNEIVSNDIGSVEIGANEIPKKQMIEHFESRLNPCTLIDNHMKQCEICRNKFAIEKKIESNHQLSRKIDIKSKDGIEHYENLEEINEAFDNITHSQKNLLVVIIYGILVILISDLIIKDE
jgi:hypothetical protein